MEEEELMELKDKIEKRGRKIDKIEDQLEKLDKPDMQHKEHENRWKELWAEQREVFEELKIDEMPEFEKEDVIKLIDKQSKHIELEFKETGADEEYSYLYKLWQELYQVLKEINREQDE